MNLSPVFRQRFFDSNGVPLAGGLLYSYVAGTTTAQDTYLDESGTTNTNPVVLDSSGYADVWLDPTLAYKFVLKDSSSNLLWTVDNVTYDVGITTWSTNTTYSAGAIVADSSGYGLFYVSLVNNNQGNALTNTLTWRVLMGNVRTVSSDVTLAVTDDLVRSYSTSNELIHTLPSISTTPIGKEITIKDVGTGGNSTRIQGNGTDTIDGNNVYTSALGQYAQVRVKNNGGSWDVVDIGDNTVTTAKIAAGAVTSSKMASNVNLPGNAVQENGQNLIVSRVNASSTSLAILRGGVAANGTPTGGEGFSTSSPGSGATYVIGFTTAFSDAPVVVVTANYGSGITAAVTAVSSTGCTIETASGSTGGAYQSPFTFIAIGQR